MDERKQTEKLKTPAALEVYETNLLWDWGVSAYGLLQGLLKVQSKEYLIGVK